jgi:hypothetical protein
MNLKYRLIVAFLLSATDNSKSIAFNGTRAVSLPLRPLIKQKNTKTTSNGTIATSKMHYKVQLSGPNRAPRITNRISYFYRTLSVVSL